MTELIAQIAGPYWIVTGLGFLLSRGYYERMILGNASSDPVLINLSGVAHFVLGMAVLVAHFRWDTFAEIGVTLLGVALVAKGGALIALPEQTLQAPKNVGRALTMSAIGFLCVGFFFCYVGYGPLFAS